VPNPIREASRGAKIDIGGARGRRGSNPTLTAKRENADDLRHRRKHLFPRGDRQDVSIAHRAQRGGCKVQAVCVLVPQRGVVQVWQVVLDPLPGSITSRWRLGAVRFVSSLVS
jgi:hypothetical protein